MSRRFLCPGIEEDVFAGDWDAILGILEDAHRWAVDSLSLCAGGLIQHATLTPMIWLVASANNPLTNHITSGPSTASRPRARPSPPRGNDTTWAARGPPRPKFYQRRCPLHPRRGPPRRLGGGGSSDSGGSKARRHCWTSIQMTPTTTRRSRGGGGVAVPGCLASRPPRQAAAAGRRREACWPWARQRCWGCSSGWRGAGWCFRWVGWVDVDADA